ncbi:UNVERIFIED_CONTAM: hypothetical protein FKN15_072394 [Acipenser sinensis]
MVGDWFFLATAIVLCLMSLNMDVLEVAHNLLFLLLTVSTISQIPLRGYYIFFEVICRLFTALSLYGTFARLINSIGEKTLIPIGVQPLSTEKLQDVLGLIKRCWVKPQDLPLSTVTELPDALFYVTNGIAALSAIHSQDVHPTFLHLTVPWVLIPGAIIQVYVSRLGTKKGRRFGPIIPSCYAAIWASWTWYRFAGVLLGISTDFAGGFTAGAVAFLVLYGFLMLIGAYVNVELLSLTLVMEVIAVCFMLSTLGRLPYQLEIAMLAIFSLICLYGTLASLANSIFTKELLPLGPPLLKATQKKADKTPPPPPCSIATSRKTSGLLSISKLLDAGEVCGVPTDTVYALAASCKHPQAIEKIYNIKDRPQEKPICICISNLEQLSTAKPPFSPLLWEFMRNVYPGGISCIVKKDEWLNKLGVGPAYDRVGTKESIMIRVPDHTVTAHLCNMTGPLAITSANPSGEPDSTHHVMEITYFLWRPDQPEGSVSVKDRRGDGYTGMHLQHKQHQILTPLVPPLLSHLPTLQFLSSPHSALTQAPSMGRGNQQRSVLTTALLLILIGVTLWDKEALTKDLDVHAKPNTEFKITSSDSIKEKSSLLDVSASLKCLVTMHYSTTNRFEQLTMSQLGKIVYPQVFEQQTATHIVMAVLYGAQAFFVFDQMASEEENKQDIEGNLKVMVKKIPKFSIEGGGALKMTDKDKENVQKFSCTFHGDFEMKHNPTTYLEALDVYKTLPGLLGEKGEKAVPVRVWLYPLKNLDSKAAKLVREISVSLVCGAQTVLEELNEVSMRCNDMTSDSFIRHFSDLKEKLDQFQGLFLQYKPVLQKALCRVLPSIRGGGQEEQVLADVLKTHKQSPFSSHLLEKWLNEKESEIDILRLFTAILKGIPIMSSKVQLNKALFDPEIETVICFTFTSLSYEEPYLPVLMKYLHSEEFKMLQGQRNFIKNVETQPWFTSPTLSATMRVNLESFRGFAEANKDYKKTSFLIASVSDTSCPGASIYLYRRGKLENPQFQPVSKPNPPVLTDTQPDRVTLNLLPSQTGETERYRVEYRAVQRGAQTEGQWTVTDTPDTQGTWTLSGLQAGTLYQIRYRSVSAVGVSEASEAIEIETKPNPRGPEELSIKRVGSQTVQVTWKEPASEEERQSILCYRVEYKDDSWGEWVAKQSKPGECVCTLEGLKYPNPYRVRVSTVFTEAETSAASQEAEVPHVQATMQQSKID